MLIKNIKDKYDAVVIGGGHAGVEASHALATLGIKTLLVCLNVNKIANMPCNPNIGGSAKGIVVREIDALGGIMGNLADRDGAILQMKVLNMSKGPGVRCYRAQEDKIGYPKLVQDVLLNKKNLDIIEDEVKSLSVKSNTITGITLSDSTFVPCKVLVIATGTFMESRLLIGEEIIDAGPDGTKSSHGLSKSIKDLGVKIIRLKTGTPPRIDPDSIDYSKLEIEEGSSGYYNFSYDNNIYRKKEDMLPCYITYTNEVTHKIIRDNLTKSARFSGLVEGVGPRYCPSIEDKVVRFASKDRHQLFLEPESIHFKSTYVQGLSTSFSKEIQEQIVHSILGLEKAKILKYAYAIEYDSIEPSELTHSLSLKNYKGIYIAGQIASTSGYEEAAALGLIAGINAERYLKKKDEFILSRDEAYIGIMIDDIVTKGSLEPYRLLSSRSEYRLLTRNDNADIRLLKKGYEIGLNSKERFNRINSKNEKVFETIKLLENTKVGNNTKIKEYIKSLNFPEINGNENLKQLLKRQNVSYLELEKYIQLPKLSEEEVFKVETEIKYEGFIKAEIIQAERRKSSETTLIPDNIDYLNMDGISLEAREKLNLIRPKNLGEASRITNVHPADIDVLYFYIKRLSKK